jgi:hypothetical protein
MHWSRVRSILIAVATLTCSAPALADEFVIQASPPSADAGAEAVVTIGDPATAVDASAGTSRIELPAVRINPTDTSASAAGSDAARVDFAPATPAATVPVHGAAAATSRDDDIFVDPATGLMIPRFANPAPVSTSARRASTRTSASTRRQRTPTYGHLHVDPATGLMIPDFGESTFPAAAPAGRTANGTPHGATRTSTNALLPGHVHFDPSTGLMVPSDMELPRGPSTF